MPVYNRRFDAQPDQRGNQVRINLSKGQPRANDQSVKNMMMRKAGRERRVYLYIQSDTLRAPVRVPLITVHMIPHRLSPSEPHSTTLVRLFSTWKMQREAPSIYYRDDVLRIWSSISQRVIGSTHALNYIGFKVHCLPVKMVSTFPPQSFAHASLILCSKLAGSPAPIFDRDKVYAKRIILEQACRVNRHGLHASLVSSRR